LWYTEKKTNEGGCFIRSEIETLTKRRR